MKYRISELLIALLLFIYLISCGHVSKRMPGELSQMRGVLTQDDPDRCRQYHYNFERLAPRLYSDQQQDSILNAIEYIKTECGPASNLELTRLLLLIDQGRFDDSLIGLSTVSQMLWHRAMQEQLIRWNRWDFLYGGSQQIDNSHDNFTKFQTQLANRVSTDSLLSPDGRTLGIFYSGSFDSAFSRIQSDELNGTAIRRSYDSFVSRTKQMFPTRGNVAILIGNWIPQGNNRLLGNHPDVGLQLGVEGKVWRTDLILNLRFLSAKSEYLVDSLGSLVSTDKFSSVHIGIEGGYMFVNSSKFSTDFFVGLGYDAVSSIDEEGDPNSSVNHGSFALSFGLRQRVFLNRNNGWYLGGIVKYSRVEYSNPRGGTDLSGNTLTVSIVSGWSIHETLYQFLKNLNYKGKWRQ